MNEAACYAIEKLWTSTVKARALCPLIDEESAVGQCGYISPPWYEDNGAIYFVNLAKPLTKEDVRELIHIGDFINRSFVISMVAVLEENDVLPSGTKLDDLDCSKNGVNHVKLIKLLRHKFAHGKLKDAKLERISDLFKKVFPDRDPGLSIPIDDVLEPLKDGVLAYIRATT